jgi:peptide deformylase
VGVGKAHEDSLSSAAERLYSQTKATVRLRKTTAEGGSSPSGEKGFRRKITMAIRNVVQVGDDVLRQKCFPVEEFDEKLHALLEDMRDTVKAEQGAGLAAPQVGILRRLAVVDVEEGYFELINPVIHTQKGEQNGWEGCLSVRGKSGVVSRPMKVTVSYQDRFGEKHVIKAKGFFARALCHEIDHLDGVLYIDKASHIQKD